MGKENYMDIAFKAMQKKKEEAMTASPERFAYRIVESCPTDHIIEGLECQKAGIPSVNGGGCACADCISKAVSPLVEALEAIIKHQESAIKGLPGLSTTAQIARKALEDFRNGR